MFPYYYHYSGPYYYYYNYNFRVIWVSELTFFDTLLYRTLEPKRARYPERYHTAPPHSIPQYSRLLVLSRLALSAPRPPYTRIPPFLWHHLISSFPFPFPLFLFPSPSPLPSSLSVSLSFSSSHTPIHPHSPSSLSDTFKTTLLAMGLVGFHSSFASSYADFLSLTFLSAVA